MLTFHELHDITGNGENLSGVVLKDIKAKTTVAIDCDAMLPMLGFVSDLGAIGGVGAQSREGRDRREQRDGDGPPGDLRGGRHHDVSGEAEADRDGLFAKRRSR